VKVCDKTCIFIFFPIINKYFLMAKRSLLSRCPLYIKCNIWRIAVRPFYIQNAWFLKVNTRSSIKRNFKRNIKLILMGMASEDGRLMELTQNRVRLLALVLAVIKFGSPLPES
jgi:hypothetical protein